jgi:hypothetical protein
MTRIALFLPFLALFSGVGDLAEPSSTDSLSSTSGWAVQGYVECRDGEVVIQAQLGPLRGQFPGGEVLRSECRYPTR